MIISNFALANSWFESPALSIINVYDVSSCKVQSLGPDSEHFGLVTDLYR
jgi:hypothetical protein